MTLSDQACHDMCDCDGTMTDRIAELETENALLHEYHAACERFFAQYRAGAFLGEGTYVAVMLAREALRQYEPEAQP